MAVIKNISGETRHLFRPDAPPVYDGDEITIPDEDFVGRAWPTDTWQLVTAPAKPAIDASPVDAVLYLPPGEPPADLDLSETEQEIDIKPDASGSVTKKKAASAAKEG